MTCKECGRKVRGRPAKSGVCPPCREMLAERAADDTRAKAVDTVLADPPLNENPSPT